MNAFRMQNLADFDREQAQRRQNDQPAIVIESAGNNFRLELALASLHYNQQFINFIDAKANSLLLVNSLFLTMGAAGGGWKWLCVLFSLGTIMLCLAVLWTRKSSSAPRERGQLFYYKHLLRRRGREDLVHDFHSIEEREALEATVRQIHDLAQLADRKFSSYQLAQTATALSVPLWLGLKLTTFLNW
jgi:hypothetical protein